jgi:hypothetical protein
VARPLAAFAIVTLASAKPRARFVGDDAANGGAGRLRARVGGEGDQDERPGSPSWLNGCGYGEVERLSA